MKDSNVAIRKATKEDKVQVAKVLLTFYNMNNIDEAAATFLTEIGKSSHYIVASNNNKIIGIVSWTMHGLPKHGLFELVRICIAPEFRGKGIAAKLIKRLVDDARFWYHQQGAAIRKLYLLTHEDNFAAQNFYEKVGFSHEATLHNHYYQDKDERIYTMFFTSQ